MVFQLSGNGLIARAISRIKQCHWLVESKIEKSYQDKRTLIVPLKSVGFLLWLLR